MTQAIDLVPLDGTHLPEAVRLSRQAGWPHRPEDWALSLSVSTGIAAVEDGRVVGTAMVSEFGPVATVNMIIVDETMRGRGVGRRVVEAAMARSDSAELRLVATQEGLPLYEKLGFRATGQIVQHQGIATAMQPGQPVEPGTTADLARCVQMDSQASGMARGALLSSIARMGELLLTEGGFALIRPFGRGHVLGPVVAQTPAAARALMAEAATRCAGHFLRVDLNEGQGLQDHAAALGLPQVGGGVAMRRLAPGTAAFAPSGPFTTYALTSQALG